MCLILFSYKKHPHFKLILASNRDEFYERPTKVLHRWGNGSSILAGQDRTNNGTWLGVSQDLKISAITNYRDLSSIKDNAPSRGLLVSNFLENNDRPLDYIKKISKTAGEYNGFNFIAGDRNAMFYFSNKQNKIEEIEAGIHGLSNRFLNSSWPKLEKGKKMFEQIIQDGNELAVNEIFELLNDSSLPQDSELPDTGVGIEWERILAPIFIKTELYGTRASSIITIDYNDRITFIEKSYIKTASNKFKTNTLQFNLAMV